MWAALLSCLDQAEKQEGCRALIITSGLKRPVFTAGNDLKELYAPMTSAEKFKSFWMTQTTFLTRLYASPLYTIAAIPGECPAGGCILSMCCDYRIMVSTPESPSKIGLNEVALGIPVPKFWGRLMMSLVGDAKGESMLMTAEQPTATDAKAMGLIDEVCSRAEMMDLVQKRLKLVLRFPDAGRRLTKVSLRAEFAKAWQSEAEQEAEFAWKGLTRPDVQSQLAKVLERLSGAPKKPTTQLPSKL